MNTVALRVMGDETPRPLALEVGIEAWGYARLNRDEIAPLRKVAPAWAPGETPHHFFKYSDEQTILAAKAVENAIERHQLDVREQANWGVIAAPQFLGRVAGANVFRRFLATGAPGVSPHTIPQHSLHSVSGALSVLLSSRGPNVGVGGGPDALGNGLLAATSLFENSDAPATWLVCTAWNPEPLPDREGNCTNQPVCHAFALALRPKVLAPACGRLILHVSERTLVSTPETNDASVAQVVEQLIALERTPRPRALQWRTTWGATAIMLVTSPAVRLLQAA